MDREVITTTLQTMDESHKNKNSSFKFKCQQCDHMAVTKIFLKLHTMLAHCNDDTPFHCSICSYRATTMANLKRHDAVAHWTSKGGIRNCPLCEFTSHRITAVKKHMREVHLKEKPYQCGECPFRCSRAADLKRHLVSCHEKQGTYKCTECNYSTSTGSSFSKHVRNYH